MGEVGRNNWENWENKKYENINKTKQKKKLLEKKKMKQKTGKWYKNQRNWIREI